MSFIESGSQSRAVPESWDGGRRQGVCRVSQARRSVKSLCLSHKRAAWA